MKLCFWLSVGVVSTCLAAGVVGQRVLGQPEMPELPPGTTLPASRPVTGKPMAAKEPGPLPVSASNPQVVPVGPPVTGTRLPVVDGVRQVKAQGTEALPPAPQANVSLADVPAPVPPTGTVVSPPAGSVPPPAPIGQSNDLPPPPPGASKTGPAAESSPLPTPPASQDAPPFTEKADGTAIPESKPGKTEPAVSIEWVGPLAPKVGQPMPCQLQVHNTSSVPVHQVVVRHVLPDGVSHRSSQPAARVDDRLVIWHLGTLDAGQVRKLDIQLVAQAKGPLHCQATVTFTAGSSMLVQVKEPLLNVKVAGPEKVIADESATFLITLSNPGDGATENIRLKVTLPDGLEHPRGRAFEVDAGQLAAKESRNMQMVCKARGAGMQKLTIAASAEVNLSATDSAQVDVLQCKLDLAVAGPKLRYIDRHAIYALKVSNPGNAPANNVTLTEIVPAGFKFHAASASGRFDENNRTVTWALGDVLPGQNREVNLELVAAAAGDHRLVGQVVAARGVKTETEARTQVEGLSSLLLELVDVDDPVEVGAETAYEIRITNTGTKTETNLQLVCTLPEHLEFQSAKNAANQRFRVEGRQVIFEPLAKLAPRADVIFRVQVKGTLPGNARFRAVVRADGLAEPIQREEVTRIYNDDMPGR